MLTIGVLDAMPPLLDLLTSPAHHPRTRRDAGMVIYHLSLAAVNQSKVARFRGGPKALLTVASSAAEPTPIRRLALMVVCNLGACAEGRAALMDAGAMAAVSGILLSGNDAHGVAELEEWCVAAIYVLSRGSLQFPSLVRAARGPTERSGAWLKWAQPAVAGARWRRRCCGPSRPECGDGEDYGGSIVSDGLMSFRRRHCEVLAPSGDRHRRRRGRERREKGDLGEETGRPTGQKKKRKKREERKKKEKEREPESGTGT